MVLSFGELPEDMAPPEEIWLNDEELAAHFERIKDRAADKAEGYEVIPDMADNQLVKGLTGR